MNVFKSEAPVSDALQINCYIPNMSLLINVSLAGLFRTP